MVELNAASLNYGAQVLWLSIVEHVLGKLLVRKMSLLAMSDQLLNRTMEVRLMETTTESAQPADQVVRLATGFILYIDVLEQRFSSVLQIQRLVGERASQLVAGYFRVLRGVLLE